MISLSPFFAVLFDVPDDIRPTLHNTAFHNIREIIEVEMSAINFGIMQEVYSPPARELADGDFYEPSCEMQFIVAKYTTKNIHDDDEVLVCLKRFPHMMN